MPLRLCLLRDSPERKICSLETLKSLSTGILSVKEGISSHIATAGELVFGHFFAIPHLYPRPEIGCKM